MKTPMKYELPETTKQALRYLVQTAASDDVVVTGFAFRIEPPAITSFGTRPDQTDIKLYEFLCDLAEKKKTEGLVVVDRVEKPV